MKYECDYCEGIFNEKDIIMINMDSMFNHFLVPCCKKCYEEVVGNGKA